MLSDPLIYIVQCTLQKKSIKSYDHCEFDNNVGLWKFNNCFSFPTHEKETRERSWSFGINSQKPNDSERLK